MKKDDREYPATHSMDTAWYLADADGNVALMEYGDDGPVPWGIPQTGIDTLLFGHEDNIEDSEFQQIRFTEEQIEGILSALTVQDDYNNWFGCILQIDTARESEYLEIAKKWEFDPNLCFSKEYGLYRVDSFIGNRYNDPKDTPRPDFRQMLDNGLIKSIYIEPCYWYECFEQYEKGNLPFYIYSQPCSPQLLQQRVHVPKHPVKIEQCPYALQTRIHRLPIRFDDCKELQVAEWHPSSVTGLDGYERFLDNEYSLLPIVGGGEAYLKTDICENFKDICYYKSSACGECWECEWYDVPKFTDKPTVIFVKHPLRKDDYKLEFLTNPIIPHCMVVPLSNKIGLPVDCQSSKEVIDDASFADLFHRNKKIFEFKINRHKPYVLIVDERALPILKSEYEVRDNAITICQMEYPFFMWGEWVEKIKEIEQLAMQPFRGVVSPQVISVEEMRKLKQ